MLMLLTVKMTRMNGVMVWHVQRLNVMVVTVAKVMIQIMHVMKRL
jgi:hypothetical protein